MVMHLLSCSALEFLHENKAKANKNAPGVKSPVVQIPLFSFDRIIAIREF